LRERRAHLMGLSKCRGLGIVRFPLVTQWELVSADARMTALMRSWDILRRAVSLFEQFCREERIGHGWRESLKNPRAKL
jgi:hypothetical protein